MNKAEEFITTGEKIFEDIKKKHKLYISSENHCDPQPVVYLTTQQCFKLLSILTYASLHYNRIDCLASGLLDHVNILSVRVEKVIVLERRRKNV